MGFMAGNDRRSISLVLMVIFTFTVGKYFNSRLGHYFQLISYMRDYTHVRFLFL
jgi:hypothetical protein